MLGSLQPYIIRAIAFFPKKYKLQCGRNRRVLPLIGVTVGTVVKSIKFIYKNQDCAQYDS